MTQENWTCKRCEKSQPEIGNSCEYCWWCLEPLCEKCWETFGHCGHAEAEAENARAKETLSWP